MPYSLEPWKCFHPSPRSLTLVFFPLRLSYTRLRWGRGEVARSAQLRRPQPRGPLGLWKSWTPVGRGKARRPGLNRGRARSPLGAEKQAISGRQERTSTFLLDHVKVSKENKTGFYPTASLSLGRNPTISFSPVRYNSCWSCYSLFGKMCVLLKHQWSFSLISTPTASYPTRNMEFRHFYKVKKIKQISACTV